MSAQHESGDLSGQSYPLALCDNDTCPWKHAGVTSKAATSAAQRHVVESGHAVTLFDESSKRVGRVVLSAEVHSVG